jgi:hypothetical protein
LKQEGKIERDRDREIEIEREREREKLAANCRIERNFETRGKDRELCFYLFFYFVFETCLMNMFGKIEAQLRKSPYCVCYG